MGTEFVSIFQQADVPVARGKYLSRIFGIFSEEIVHTWAADHHCTYEDLGRPTLRKPFEKSGSTLDFTLRDKRTGKSYVTELKCEIEYQNYKYLVLSNVKQLAHHKKAAFLSLLAAAARESEQRTFVHGKELSIHGAILIWGAATLEGKRSAIDTYGFAEVLTMAEIIHDLREWRNEPYRKLIEDRRSWSDELFEALLTY